MNRLGKIDVHGISLRGSDREENQDQFAVGSLKKTVHLRQSNLSVADDSRMFGDSKGHLILVADAEGTRSSGSDLVDRIMDFFTNEMPWLHQDDADPSDVSDVIRDGLQRALQGVRASIVRAHCAVTLAFVDWPHLYVMHTGTGRCYLQRHGSAHRLTHALPMRRSRLKPPTLEVQHRRLEVGDVLLLGTDGVFDAAPGPEVERVLATSLNAESMGQHLLPGTTAHDRTVVIARFLPSNEQLNAATQPKPPQDLSGYRDEPKLPPPVTSVPREVPDRSPRRLSAS